MDINKVHVNNVEGLRPAKSSTDRDSVRLGNYGTQIDTKIELSRDNAADIVDTLNSAAKSINKRVSFLYHEKTNRVIMKITDTKTNEIIREIPPKEMIRLLEHIHEMIGMFVDESR
jgi:flagellar protein FlaG